MDNSNNTTINSLLPHNNISVGFDSFLNNLRQEFDSNFLEWEKLPPGDPQRQVLVDENEKLIDLILDAR